MTIVQDVTIVAASINMYRLLLRCEYRVPCPFLRMSKDSRRLSFFGPVAEFRLDQMIEAFAKNKPEKKERPISQDSKSSGSTSDSRTEGSSQGREAEAEKADRKGGST